MSRNDFKSVEEETMLKHGVMYDEAKSVFITKLHKDLYLRKDEVKSREVIEEFFELIEYLKSNPEYGVKPEWSSSELNRYVYLTHKEELKNRFPNTIEALSRFYDDSSIIEFYKSQGAISPTIIDLVGTTGAGKTTFCQQFVDDESKKILKLTVTDSAESTVIQTDILILDKTPKKLFLRARSKSEIMQDLLLVALDVDLEATGSNVKTIIKKSSESLDKDLIDKVNNCFMTEALFEEYKTFVAEVQSVYAISEDKDKLKWVMENSESQNFELILDKLVQSITDNPYFYGYRMEFDLESDAEYKILKTIANTEFKNRKEDFEDYPELIDAISIRLLFDHATLVLPCSEKAKRNIDYDFMQGMVLRDSQGHKLDEQNGIASDFEVKNKIFLIPIDNGGYLIDDRYSNIFEKILISEPKNSIFVLTKIDMNKAYKRYKDSDYVEDKKFKRDFSEKIANTHNSLVKNFKKKINIENNSDNIEKDETTFFENFMTSFNNAYLSEIEEDSYESEAHKLTYSGDPLEEFDNQKLQIEYLEESWFKIVEEIFRENKLTFHNNITRVKEIDLVQTRNVVQKCTNSMGTLVNYFISQQSWENDLDTQLDVFNRDFRSVYNSASVWYYSNFINDGNSSELTWHFKDLTAITVRDISSYIVKDEGGNYLSKFLKEPLKNLLLEVYKSKSGNSEMIMDSISSRIINNSFEKAAKIAYKVYDRGLKDIYHLSNVHQIYADKSGSFIKPKRVTYQNVKLAKRRYSTYTEYYAGVYCNLMAKYKYNLEKYFLMTFKIVLERELSELEQKVK